MAANDVDYFVFIYSESKIQAIKLDKVMERKKNVFFQLGKIAVILKDYHLLYHLENSYLSKKNILLL